MNIYDIEIKDAQQNPTSLAEYDGKVLLIVNTASECGFTPQFEGLETLYKKHKDSGLEVLGFPCNQFGGQDPGTTDDSVKFCKTTYSISFPMFDKIDVNGPNESPLYSFLKKEKSGLMGKKIKWNFTKFLVDKKGNVVKRYGSTSTPEKIEKDISKFLQQ